ncbi:hypothetical protein H4R23_002737 [Coemansia sp. Cherry 401B]|nr:hypothetical protein IWW52_001340 [Coemansia sp. RSA 2704]KAJ2732914.1 hypothetical protein H4R23_002737 [Coemansia sp. Cherry 401B]
MAKLTDLPYELLLELLICSGNEHLVTACRWTYFCLAREATPCTCYRFARSRGQWNKAQVLSSALAFRFLSMELLDQIDRNEHELLPPRRKSKRRKRETGPRVADVKIPVRLYRIDDEWEMPKMKELRAADRPQRKRRKLVNPNQQRFDLVRRLLAMDISCAGAKCSTGLVLSAKAGNMAMVRLLLKNGADATAGGDNKALLMAVVYGHLDIVKRLVKAGAQPSSLALRYAVQKKHSDVVAWLMKKGVAPDMTTIKLLDNL